MKSLRTAATGMLAQALNVDVISNNIANMNTIGFKRSRAEFQDLLYQTIERAGAQSSDAGTVVPTGVQIGSGVKAGATYRIIQQGSATQTGNDLDVMIQGRGYLQVTLPSGETAYTRAGNLSTNDQGQLVTDDGYLLDPAITIPQDATDIIISPSGQVQVIQPGSPTANQVGQLELATFFNEAGLDPLGDNLYQETAASGAATTGAPNSEGYGKLLQGYVEASNVDAVSEVTALIVAQRAYEMNSKVVTTSDEMLSVAGQLKS